MRIIAVGRCPLCGSSARTPFENDPKESDSIHVLKCLDCGLIYMSGVVHSSDTEGLYVSYSSDRDSRDPVLRRKRQLMYALDYAYASRFMRETDRRILDIGCGEADFLACFPETIDKHGLEIDRIARRTAASTHTGITLHASFDDLPHDTLFDIMLFRGTLQYMPDLHETARFCERVLAPGGRVMILATPNADSILATIQKEYWVLCDKIQHRYWFGIAQIRQLFGPAFAVEGYDLPYLGTPYENYVSDLAVLLRMLSDREALRERIPFFGSMMNVVLHKRS